MRVTKALLIRTFALMPAETVNALLFTLSQPSMLRPGEVAVKSVAPTLTAPTEETVIRVTGWTEPEGAVPMVSFVPAVVADQFSIAVAAIDAPLALSPPPPAHPAN